MRMINTICANYDWTLDVTFADGELRRFDVKPLLQAEAFRALQDIDLFKTARSGGYFVEWANEADLSADTLHLEGKALP